MNIRIYEIINNTKVEGPGNRTCIFVQGCLKHCKYCNSKQTWDITSGKEYEINKLAQHILSNKNIEGVTFSGGEPFLQSKELYQLGKLIKKHNLSIVTFTGFNYNFIKKINDSNWNNLLEITDLLISGEFDINKMVQDKIWIGSSNQEYHFLSNRYKYLENKLNLLENKIEIRLKKDGSIVINGMGDNKKINKLFNFN
ncbi:4Fe-4S single cluster domain-containing protein [Methanosphaera sp. ISO3-F5]|uniref:4Fe-4S single cluster domain-containing protein n=1 Tax=Methanosphaera sp. ISO3-F5 TaxID=1452353 RepID=UPI002B262888|nr:4Fe-4S single cluster domain-containing protein [Methanosphaera sp. ISO3-F5]WQH63673.1 4Fe-4S single cluster domain-containing protein [Methanosphaera sp. ISO3-F5]